MRLVKWTIFGLGMLVAISASGALAADASGYIYGTVETRSGNTYEGMLRWGTEEAFWGDHFNSTKEELPYLKEYRQEDRKRSKIKIFGVTVGYHTDNSYASRQFVARFGDIKEIEVVRRNRVDVTTRDGVVHELDGGSNDIGAQITIQDDNLGAVKLEWDRIERIVFSPAPAGLEPKAHRIWGVLKTEDDTFEGFIQWDSQESVSTDKLDGESDDGDLSIEMGRIRAIEKRNRNGAWVELKDGRRVLLEGTNDVDHSIRGIFVEDKRYGRVKVSWDAFERIDFRDAKGNGPGYGDYAPVTRLKGKVTDYEGKTHAGRLIFDLDESASWEILNGSRNDVEYHIPFAMVRSISPQRHDAALVVLDNGEEIVLSDGQDVSEKNDGVVVIRDNDREMFLPWEDIERIEFD